MPKGFDSIADIKVVIDSDLKPLTEQMEVARGLVAKFAGDGSSALKGFDAAVESTGAAWNAVLARALGPVGLVISAMNTLNELWDKHGEQVLSQADKYGLGDQVRDIQKSVVELTATVGEALPIAYASAKTAAIDYVTQNITGSALVTARTKESASIIDSLVPKAYEKASGSADLHFAGIGAGTSDVLKATGGWKTTVESVPHVYDSATKASGDSLKKLAEISESTMSQMMDDTALNINNWADVAQKIADTVKIVNAAVVRVYKPDDDLGLRELEQQLLLSEHNVAELAARVRATMQFGPGEIATWFGIDKHTQEVEEYIAEFQRLLNMRDAFNAKNKDSALGSWSVSTTTPFQEATDAETVALKRKHELLGLLGPELDAYTERLRLEGALTRGGNTGVDEDRAAIERKVSAVRALAQAKADWADDAIGDAADDKRADKVSDIIDGLNDQKEGWERQTEALKLSNYEQVRAAFLQQQYANLAKAGATATEEQAMQIEAAATATAQASVAFSEMKDSLKQVQAVGGVVTKGLENQFSNFTKGAQIDVRSMVQGMLADLAMLTFKQGVTQPLAQLLTGGGSTGGAGLLGGLFGGFRADGGSVDQGQAYIVGEQGPEWFVPKGAGTVLPNGAGPAGGAVSVQLHNHINAAGAYPESIAQITSALRQLEGAMPGRIVEVMREVRERGI